MSSDEVDKVVTQRLIHLKIDIKIIWNQRKVAIFGLSLYSVIVL